MPGSPRRTIDLRLPQADRFHSFGVRPMRRIRFTIASLLVVVLFVAVGFAALRESNDLWDSGLFTLTLAVLLVSILLAIHRTESRRAFWLGFRPVRLELPGALPGPVDRIQTDDDEGVCLPGLQGAGEISSASSGDKE